MEKMKKVLVAAALALVANTASAVISGSSHDLTTAWGGGTIAKCAFCHMPHNSPDTSGLAPLWARNTSAPVNGYTVYSSVFGGQKAAPPGVGSRLCLSCHDGTQAIAAIYNAAGVIQNAGAAKLTSGIALVGTNLGQDHPVGITYNSTFNNNNAGLGTITNTAFKLFNNMVECPSCHNAHQGKITGGSYANRQFMVNTTADFCSACHMNK